MEPESLGLPADRNTPDNAWSARGYPQGGAEMDDGDLPVSSERERVASLPRLRRGPNSLPDLPSDDRGRGSAEIGLTALPRRRRRVSAGFVLSFLLCFVLPVGAAIAYYGFLASNQYVAEFRFSVDDTSPQATSSASTVLSALLPGGGPSSTVTQNYLVTDYLLSRQAIDDLEKRIDLKQIYSTPTADWWARFNPNRPVEAFVRYWQGMVSATFDNMTGLATVKVRAFTAKDAQLVADNLSRLAEELINGIANRSKQNSIRFAENEVRKAEDRLKDIRVRLTDFRNKYGIVDPTSSVVASNSALTQTLRANLAQFETNRATFIKQGVPPTASSVQTLDSQIKATKEQIKIVESQVGKQGTDGPALSEIVGQYELLDLERQFAQTMLTGTMQSLDQARANAAAQFLYITPYVRPSLPEASTYPRRVIFVLEVVLFAFLSWMVVLFAVRSVHEHYG